MMLENCQMKIDFFLEHYFIRGPTHSSGLINRYQIVFTLFLLIWNASQSENGKYNLILFILTGNSVYFNWKLDFFVFRPRYVVTF